MSSIKKILEQVLRGTSDANVLFHDLCRLLLRLGFDERTKGSHHIFRKARIPERVTLQKNGNKAKPYQVRQVITKHGLADEIDG